MTISIYVVGAVLIYLGLLAFITYRALRSESDLEFASENHNVSVLGTFSSLFVSTIDGAGLVFLVALAGVMGFGLYWFVAGIILAAIILYVQAPRIRRLVEEKRYLTQNDMLKSQIGTWTSSLILVIVTVLVAAQAASLLHITGQIFSTLFAGGLTFWVIIASVIVGLYMFVGGYKTVIKTDIVQFLAIILVLIVALFVSDLPSFSFATESFMMGGDWRSVLGTVLFFGLMFYPLPAIWQRMYTAGSAKIARKSLTLYSVTYLPIYFVIIAFGMTLVALYPEADPNTILYTLADGAISPVLGMIISVALLALTMSSVDTQAYLFLSTIASNWLGIDKDENPARYRRTLRTLIAIAFVVLTVVALTITNVVTFIVGALTLLAVLTPALFASVYSKGVSRALDRGMFLVTVAGTGVYLYMMWQGMFTDFLMNAVPGIVACVLGLIVWFYIAFAKGNPA